MFKFVLAFCALMLVSLSVIHAKDDKWIDGIRFREGYNQIGNTLFIGDDPIVRSSTDIDERKSALFPVVITFPETLMNSWSFRGAYFDYAPLQTHSDIPPLGEDSRRDQINKGGRLKSKFIYLRNKEEHRNYLKKQFFPKYLSDIEINTLPVNWAMSYDNTNSSIMLGYLWGLFLPLGDLHRFFKIGLGIGVSRIESEVKINLCDSYTVELNYVEENELDLLHDGKCNNPTILVNFSYLQADLSLGGMFLLWERVSKDSIWQFFGMKLLGNPSFMPSSQMLRTSKFKTLDNQLINFNTSLQTYEILTYTYRF